MDVACTEQLNWPVTAVVPDTVILSGDGVHVTPGADVDGVTITVPVNPPLGVTVTVEFAAAPVDELRVTAVSDTVKLPICACVTVTAIDDDREDPV